MLKQSITEEITHEEVVAVALEALEAMNISLISGTNSLTSSQVHAHVKIQEAISLIAGSERLYENREQAKEETKGFDRLSRREKAEHNDITMMDSICRFLSFKNQASKTNCSKSAGALE